MATPAETEGSNVIELPYLVQEALKLGAKLTSVEDEDDNPAEKSPLSPGFINLYVNAALL